MGRAAQGKKAEKAKKFQKKNGGKNKRRKVEEGGDSDRRGAQVRWARGMCVNVSLRWWLT